MRKISPAYKDLIESSITLPPPPPQRMQRSNGTGWAPAQGWIVTPLKLEKRDGIGLGVVEVEKLHFFWGVLSFCMPRILSSNSATNTYERRKRSTILTNLAESWVVDYDSADFPQIWTAISPKTVHIWLSPL